MAVRERDRCTVHREFFRFVEEVRSGRLDMSFRVSQSVHGGTLAAVVLTLVLLTLNMPSFAGSLFLCLSLLCAKSRTGTAFLSVPQAQPARLISTDILKIFKHV